MNSGKVIYIAGSVSDREYFSAVADFNEAEKHLAFRGDIPLNPLRLCDPSWSWQKCMRTCIKALMDCNGIYMLKGWRKSRGAKLEHFIALKLGLSIELQ